MPSGPAAGSSVRDEGAPPPQGLTMTAVEAGRFVLQTSAAAARAVAEAASGRPQPPREGENFLAGLLRNGSTAVGGFVGLAVKAARDRMTPAAARPAQTETRSRGRGPELHPGATARVPLSIDNPGGEPMVGLQPRLLGATRDGSSTEPAFVVRFTPERLDVAPRDFEKLVVTIELAGDIAPGEWSLFFTLSPDGSDPHELPFQIAADAGGAEAGATGG
ncbi:MAG: hypothetical protein JWO25_2556 [Alphaproteobacteria bacterium]|nr:hypothetical protein [Alphaproteobacteria bacterium]